MDVTRIVKPLEWIDHSFVAHAEEARIAFGSYWAQWDDETKAWFASLEMGEVEGPIILSPSDVLTLDEAKAAAQADYNRRILSAIDADAVARMVAEAVAKERERCAEIAKCMWLNALEDLDEYGIGNADREMNLSYLTEAAIRKGKT